MRALFVTVIALVLLAPNLAPAQNSDKPWFRNATKEFGSIGGGPAALVDLDGDGFPDLICDGRIYKNDGGKRFLDITKEAGVAGSGTACVADIDNDGLPDIYFSGGTGTLYHNLGNLRFEDWTKKVPPNKHQRSQAAAFGDLNGDGHVDLYVSNYEDWKDNTYPFPHLLFRNRGGDKGFEPWNSEHNKKLIAQMPNIYRSPLSKLQEGGKTTYLVPAGKGTMFEGQMGLRVQDITDGSSNTIMVLEVDDAKAVVWTQPEDYSFNAKDPLAGLARPQLKGFHAAFADGSVRFLSATLRPQTLLGLFSPRGGEVVDPND